MSAAADAVLASRTLDRIRTGAQARYPDKDVSVSAIEACHPLFLRYHNTYIRVKVQMADGEIKHGRVSNSLGWAPVLLLILRIDSRGSSVVIGPDDRIIAVQRADTKYEAV